MKTCESMPNTNRWQRTGERLDDLELANLFLLQNPDAFCFGTDAVLLAHFAQAVKTDRVLDLGTGNGILLLLLWGKYQPKELVGLEIQPGAADLALRNVQMNGLDARITVLEGDLRQKGILEGSAFSLVVANPPYHPMGAGALPKNWERQMARHEVMATLEQVLDAAMHVLCPAGRLCMVYPAERMAELLFEMRQRQLEPKRLQLVQARDDTAPHLLLVEAVWGGRMGLKVLPTLVLYDGAGCPSQTMEQIYGIEKKHI